MGTILGAGRRQVPCCPARGGGTSKGAPSLVKHPAAELVAFWVLFGTGAGRAGRGLGAQTGHWCRVRAAAEGSHSRKSRGTAAGGKAKQVPESSRALRPNFLLVFAHLRVPEPRHQQQGESQQGHPRRAPRRPAVGDEG